MIVPFFYYQELEDKLAQEHHDHWCYSLFAALTRECSKFNWPIIAQKKYFDYFISKKSKYTPEFNQKIMTTAIHHFKVDRLCSAKEIYDLKKYPITNFDELALSMSDEVHINQFILKLLNIIECDNGEVPKGILLCIFTPPPTIKIIANILNRENIPFFMFDIGLRPPFSKLMNYYLTMSCPGFNSLYERWKRFSDEKPNVPILSRKGLLRLFSCEKYLSDIHEIDKHPKYEVGVVLDGMKERAIFFSGKNGREYLQKNEFINKVTEVYGNEHVIIRGRPEFSSQSQENEYDSSPTMFHFACLCNRIIGQDTKAVFEAMQVGRRAHLTGEHQYDFLCNDGIKNDDVDSVSLEVLNFIYFGFFKPEGLYRDEKFLNLMLSQPLEKELYMLSYKYYTQGISKKNMTFYYMHDERRYKLGDILYFTSNHKPHEYAAYYCTSGLSFDSIGQDGTISKGSNTSFFFNIVEPYSNPLIITVVFNSISVPSKQIITCEANGEICTLHIDSNNLVKLKLKLTKKLVNETIILNFNYNPELVISFKWMYISDGNHDTLDYLSDEVIRKEQILSNQVKQIYQSKSWKIGHGLIKAAKTLLSKFNIK